MWNKTLGLSAALLALGLSTTAAADGGDALFGAAIGAAIGHSVNGRDGALVGARHAKQIDRSVLRGGGIGARRLDQDGFGGQAAA